MRLLTRTLGLVALTGVLAATRGQAGSQIPTAGLAPVGRGRLSAIYDVKATATHLVALERGLLHVLDARNPRDLREAGTLEFDRPRSRLALRHPYLYLTGFNEALGIANIADPVRPVWVGDVTAFPHTANDGFELAGDVGYLIHHGERTAAGAPLLLEVLDLAANPGRPTRLGGLDLGLRVTGEYGGMAHTPGRLFVLVRRAVGADARARLLVLDVRRPTEPRIERTFFFPEARLYRDVEVNGPLVYLLQQESATDKPSGLAIYRMGETPDLEFVGEALTTEIGIPIDLMVFGNAVYATFKRGGLLATFDVSNPAAPLVTNIYRQRDLWAAGLGMTRVGDRLYLSGDNGPSPIFDLSEPLRPRLIGRYEFQGGDASDVRVDGDVAIVLSLSDLVLYDVGSAAVPRRVGRYKGIPSFDPRDFQFNVVVAADARRALVTYETRPAQLVDLTQLASPRVSGTFTPAGLVHSSVLTGAHAALGYAETTGTGRGGVEIISIENRGRPASIATLPLGRPVIHVALRGRQLVAADSAGALTIISLEDWQRPRILGEFAATTPCPTPRLALSEDGTVAYLACAAAGSAERGVLTAIDLRDPVRPQARGRLEFPISGSTEVPIAAAGARLAFLAGATGGVGLVDVSTPLQPVLVGITAMPGVYASGLALRGRDVLIAASEDGLLIYRR